VSRTSDNGLSYTDDRQHKDQTDDLNIGFQSLGISNAASSNLAYGRPQRRTTGHDLFLSPRNRAQGHSNRSKTIQNPFLSATSAGTAATYARHSERRAATPAVGHSGYGFGTGGHQSAPGGSSGYLTPLQSAIGYGGRETGQSGRLRSHTPAIVQSQPQQFAAGLRRPQSAQAWSSSRLSDSSSTSESNPSGMRVQKQKDWRSFYKTGRVCVSD
jgi:hypothetical protein